MKRAKRTTKRDATKITDLLDVSNYVKNDDIVGNLPYIIFIALLTILYIGNIHYAERTIRKINKSEKEFKEIRWEYMSIKSELMYKSKQSQVARAVKFIGLQELTEPPGKIVIEKNGN